MKRLLVTFSLLLVAIVAFAKSPLPTLYRCSQEETQYYRQFVYNVHVTAFKRYKDINNDGKVNCVDRAVIWYRVFKELNTKGFECQIVRNVNPFTKMNHLFIRCRISPMEQWAYIEPQERDFDKCEMRRFWGWKYSNAYNIYGETDKWNNDPSGDWL